MRGRRRGREGEREGGRERGSLTALTVCGDVRVVAVMLCMPATVVAMAEALSEPAVATSCCV